MDKYLFLDFDGVLNTENYTKFLQTNGFDPNDEFGTRFDPDALQNLKAIIEQTGAKIIISSSWKEYGVEFLQELWQERNLPSEIYSITPSLIMTNYLDQIEGGSFHLPERYSKGLEINAWLEKNASGKYSYCVIDDENYFLAEQLSHLVQTSSKNGLTAVDAEKVIEILKQ